MKKIIAILFVSISCLAACKDKKTGNEKAGDVSTPGTETTAPDPAKDSAAIKTVITDFYNWYNKNYQKLMAFDLYNGIKKADQPPYKIEWDGVDKMQRYIHDSVPQLGEAYLMNQKKMLQQADSAFKVDVNDEIPYGFDYDWYTNSQEDPQYTLDEINKAKWKITTNGDDAVAEVIGSYAHLKIDMKREGGQWKIAKIGSAE